MHQLRHVAEQIRQTGPTGESNQFPAERFNGHTSSNCKSRVAANINIANNGVLDEFTNNLSYTVRLSDPADSLLEHDPDNIPEEGYAATVRAVSKLLGEMQAPDSVDLFDPETSARVGRDADTGSYGVYPTEEVRRRTGVAVSSSKFFGKGPQHRLVQWLRKNAAFTGRSVPKEVLAGLRRFKTAVIVSRPMGDNLYNSGPDTAIRVCGSVDPRPNRTRSAAFVLYQSTPGSDVVAKARSAVSRELRASDRGLRGRELERRIAEDPRCSTEPRTYLGEVEFFFKIRYGPDDLDPEPANGDDVHMERSHYLAYIRHMPVKRETFGPTNEELNIIAGPEMDAFADATLFSLTKGVGTGAHEVIACEDISELAGLIKGGDGDKDIYVVNKSGALWMDLGAVEVDVQRDATDTADSE